MKFVRGIGLFFIYPLTMLAIGFYAGMETIRFFYPNMLESPYGESRSLEESAAEAGDSEGGAAAADIQQVSDEGKESRFFSDDLYLESQAVAASPETLYVGTEYVLEETDILRHTVVETSQSLPDKYVGMTREQFLTAMEIYEMAPPLAELERGFVGLEVRSFSRERVVVQMNYRYIQPSSSFYLAAYDNEVLVYLEDGETVYIETHIRLDSLPAQLQQEIIQRMWVENEEELYHFLESYSS